MNKQFTLPGDPPKRESMLCIRLTAEERNAIQSFAKQVQKPISRLARHWVIRVAKSLAVVRPTGFST